MPDARSRLLLAMSLCVCGVAIAQTPYPQYPNRPVRIIVSVAAGGGTDTVGRSLAQKMSERLGQQFVIGHLYKLSLKFAEYVSPLML